MTEHSIIFSTEMIRAILDGRKTQTRRIVKPQPFRDEGEKQWVYRYPSRKKESLHSPNATEALKDICPYGQVGDRLWVREAFAQCGTVMAERIAYIAYKADNPLLGATSRIKPCDVPKDKPFLKTIRKYRPSIHMPKWAARIFLEITNIRVERVQDISEEDSIVEGMYSEGEELDTKKNADHPIEQFAQLWDSLNLKRGYGWDKNPWVWVIEFKRTERK